MRNRSVKRKREGGRRIRGVHPVTQQVARMLRRELTPTEQILWNALRGKQIAGVRFRKQHPVGQFVLDFYAPAAHLVVELDGSVHDSRRLEDAARTELLNAYGYRVLRFRNEDIANDLPSVLERIRRAIMESNERPPRV